MARSDERDRQTAAELAELVGLLDEIDGFEELLTVAPLSEDERRKLIRRAFGGRVSKRTEGLLMALARNGRLGLLRPVAQAFRKLLSAGREELEVVLTTAVPLDSAQRQAAAETLSRALGAEISLRARVDESLIGGAVVRVGDRVYDASVAVGLERLTGRIVGRRAELA